MSGAAFGGSGSLRSTSLTFVLYNTKQKTTMLTMMQLPLNPDVNSDQCIGFGVPPGTIHDGLRVTAASAYLAQTPDNLKVLTDANVSRVLFEGKKAIGVELSKGEKCMSAVVALPRHNFLNENFFQISLLKI